MNIWIGVKLSTSTSARWPSPIAWTTLVLKRSLPSTASTTSSRVAWSSSTLKPSSCQTSATMERRRTRTSGWEKEPRLDLKVKENEKLFCCQLTKVVIVIVKKQRWSEIWWLNEHNYVVSFQQVWLVSIIIIILFYKIL